MATGIGSAPDAHQRRTNQPGDRRLVPLDDDIGDMDLSENAKDTRCGIANSPGICGVGMNSNPHDDGAESLFPVLDSGEASCLERRVLDTASLD